MGAVVERNKVRMTIKEDGSSEEVERANDVVQTLHQIMAFNNISAEVALEQAITNEKFLQDLEDSGHTLIIARKKRWGGEKLNYLVRRPTTHLQAGGVL